MQAVLMQRGKLWVDTVPDPTPAAGEVLVRSRACGICGSDLHAALHTETFVETSRESGGAFKLTTYDPVVLGHEFCAEVVEYGPGTEGRLAPGQLVCSVPMLLREQPLAIGYDDSVPGGFAEYMLLSGSRDAAGAGRNARKRSRTDRAHGRRTPRGPQGGALGARSRARHRGRSGRTRRPSPPSKPSTRDRSSPRTHRLGVDASPNARRARSPRSDRRESVRTPRHEAREGARRLRVRRHPGHARPDLCRRPAERAHRRRRRVPPDGPVAAADRDQQGTLGSNSCSVTRWRSSIRAFARSPTGAST